MEHMALVDKLGSCIALISMVGIYLTTVILFTISRPSSVIL